MLVLCLGVLFCQCFCLVEDSCALCGVVVCVRVCVSAFGSVAFIGYV